MTDLSTEALIGLVLSFAGMLIGWVFMVKRDAEKRRKEREEERGRANALAEQVAYERGQHDSVHTELRTDVVAAHARLRMHDEEIAVLHKNDAAHTEVHNALLKQGEQMHKQIDTIHRVIMNQKRSGRDFD